MHVYCPTQDKNQKTIVNNDSGEIMEMLNSEFNSLRQDEPCPDLYPAELQAEISQLIDHMSDDVNTGVYKCAFAESQASGMLAYSPLQYVINSSQTGVRPAAISW